MTSTSCRKCNYLRKMGPGRWKCLAPAPIWVSKFSAFRYPTLRQDDLRKLEGECDMYRCRLFKTKFYVVDLASRQVDTSKYFDRFQGALDWAKKKGGYEGREFTAIKGGEILSYPNTWRW